MKMREKPSLVMSKSPIHLIFFLISILFLADTLLNVQIINKTQTVWYSNMSGIVIVGLSTIIGISFLNSFISRVYFYEEHLLIITLFKRKKILYSEIAKIEFHTAGTTPSYFYALYNSNSQVKGTINAQYVRDKSKKKFIPFLIKKNPSIKLDRKCEAMLKK